jgi:hypothetical protein
MTRFVSGDKSIVINSNINFVVNNPFFVDQNNYSFPFDLQRSEETEDFFDHAGQESSGNAQFLKIEGTLEHDTASFEGTLYVQEAGNTYNCYFISPKFWDTAKNSKLADLLADESYTFLSRAELKSTWLGGYDMVFAPVKNNTFNTAWPINGTKHTGILNDPDAFDDDRIGALFVPFLKLDVVLQKAIAASGASIGINELNELTDYQKKLLWNNYAINEYAATDDESEGETIPFVYLSVEHPITGFAEIMLPKSVAENTIFYLSQLEDPEGEIDNSTSQKIVSQIVTPDLIFRCAHTNDAYAYPCLNGFIEVGTKATDVYFESTNPMVVRSADHGLNSGDFVCFTTPLLPELDTQVLEITRITKDRFTVDFDGTIYGENPVIPIYNITEHLVDGYATIETSSSAWPDHLKVPHGLTEGQWVHVISPVLGLDLVRSAFINTEYSFSIGISAITPAPGADNGSIQKISVLAYTNHSYFAQKRKTHIITLIKNTNPCEITFKNNHYMKAGNVVSFHNTGITALDDNVFIVDSPQDTTIKLKDTDGSSFTPYNADFICITNYHRDNISETDHVNAPDIAWCEKKTLAETLNLTVDYSRHVPDYSLADLIKAVETAFGCKFLYNSFTNQINIRLYRNIVKAYDSIDITASSSREKKLVFEPLDGYIVSLAEPTGDTYYETAAPVIDFDKVVFKGNSFTFALLPLIGNEINDVRLVTNTHMLYIWQETFTGGAGWKLIGPYTYDIKSGKEEFNAESTLSTFMEDNGNVRTDQPGTCKTFEPWITAKPSLSVFFFNNPGGVDPHTSNGIDNSDNTLALAPPGSKGTYALLWQKYIYWRNNVCKGMERVISWKKEDITSFDFTKKYRINDQAYFVASINMLLKANGDVEWGTTKLYKA